MWLLDARSVCNWLAVWHTEDIRWEPEFWMGCRGSPLRLCHCCCTIILLRMLSAPFNKFTLQIRKCVISDSSVGNIYHLLPLVIAAACKLQVEQKKKFFYISEILLRKTFLKYRDVIWRLRGPSRFHTWMNTFLHLAQIRTLWIRNIG